MHPDRSIQENHCGLFLPFPSISESKTYLWQKSFFCKAVDFFLILSSRRSDHINDIEPVHRLSFSFQRFTTIVSKSRPSFPALATVFLADTCMTTTWMTQRMILPAFPAYIQMLIVLPFISVIAAASPSWTLTIPFKKGLTIKMVTQQFEQCIRHQNYDTLLIL